MPVPLKLPESIAYGYIVVITLIGSGLLIGFMVVLWFCTHEVRIHSILNSHSSEHDHGKSDKPDDGLTFSSPPSRIEKPFESGIGIGFSPGNRDISERDELMRSPTLMLTYDDE